ncbi:MAG: Mur ligase family protein [candidate division FCPU426 bacterium]
MILQSAQAALRRWTKRAVLPGLERTRRLLELCGHPERCCPAVQITGTNGKGSVAALVSSMAQAAGYRVGCFTSPHLADERERITLDGKPAKAAAFAAAVKRLLPALQRMKRQGQPATTFEAWTVLAAELFRSQGAQLAVLEVGMGGRLDATSAWQDIRLSLLTNVQLEHTDFLGTTRQAILREKAGLARPGVPMLCAEPDPALRRQLQALGQGRGFPVKFTGARPGDAVRILRRQRVPGGLAVDLKVASRTNLQLRIPLAGAFQADNLALAVAAAGELETAGFPGLRRAIPAGCRRVKWPGRLETIHRRPWVILDGAHNPAAAQALAQEFREQDASCLLIAGCMADKDTTGIAAALAPIAQQAWTVTPPDARGLPAPELARIFRQQGVPARPCRTLAAAVRAAFSAAGLKSIILITGSLYLLEPARRIVRRLNDKGF